jgi:hypothetical protein
MRGSIAEQTPLAKPKAKSRTMTKEWVHRHDRARTNTIEALCLPLGAAAAMPYVSGAGAASEAGPFRSLHRLAFDRLNNEPRSEIGEGAERGAVYHCGGPQPRR